MRLSLHVAVVLGLVPLSALAQSPTGTNGGPAAQTVRPLSLAQQMPTPPRVSFADGKLTVTANNSTMQDVIQAVHGATGTTFQVMGGPTQDRLFGQYGPGAVNTVLEQILRGSGFNYILVSAPNAPGRVKTATLMAKSNEAATPPTAQPRNPNPVNNNGNVNNGEEPPPDANVEEDVPQPEPAQEIQQFPQQQEQAPNGQTPVDPNQPKTPEQLLQELQRLQLQRQQQQQNNPNQNPQ